MMAHRKSFYANTVYPAQVIQRDKRNLSHFSTSYLKLGIRWLVEILVSASKFMSDLKIFSEYFRWSHVAREPLSAHPWSNQNSVTFAWNSNATVPSGITRGGMGEQFPGRRKFPSMSQVLSSIQHIRFWKTSVSNTGAPNLFLAPGAI